MPCRICCRGVVQQSLCYSRFSPGIPPIIIFEKSVLLFKKKCRLCFAPARIQGQPAISTAPRQVFRLLLVRFHSIWHRHGSRCSRYWRQQRPFKPVESDSKEHEHSTHTSCPNRQPAKRIKGPNRPREWKECNRWACVNHIDVQILAFIRADLAELNKKAAITSLQPRHQDSKKGISTAIRCITLQLWRRHSQFTQSNCRIDCATGWQLQGNLNNQSPLGSMNGGAET